jgi:hypothetical protein
MTEQFCKTYMAIQGTEILKQSRKPSSAIKERRRENEKVVINQYERG